MLQYETASRISSLLLLKNSPTDIDFEENLLYLIEPKTNERFVRRVSNKAMETLTSYIQNNNIGENQKIIQLSYYKVWYRQKKVFKKLGYENVSSHWFRGSRLIHLFKKGWTIVDIKEFSKHARLESLYPYLQDSGIESKKKQRELKVEW
jgi:site-specific recombinase XerD